MWLSTRTPNPPGGNQAVTRPALGEMVIEGVKTTISYHLKTLGDPAFVEGRLTGEEGARLHR